MAFTEVNLGCFQSGRTWQYANSLFSIHRVNLIFIILYFYKKITQLISFFFFLFLAQSFGLDLFAACLI